MLLNNFTLIGLFLQLYENANPTFITSIVAMFVSSSVSKSTYATFNNFTNVTHTSGTGLIITFNMKQLCASNTTTHL